MTMRNVIFSFFMNNNYICPHLNQFHVDEMAVNNFIFTYAKLYYYTYTIVNKKITNPNQYIKNQSHKEVFSYPLHLINQSINQSQTLGDYVGTKN
jgi:hypothetical protein